MISWRLRLMNSPRLEFLEHDLNSVFDSDSAYQAISGLRLEIEKKAVNLRSKLGQEIFIWGSEEVGARVYKLAVTLGYTVLGFFDSKKEKQGLELFGIKISEPKNVDRTVIIASYNTSEHLTQARILLGSRAVSTWEFLLLHSDTKTLPWNCLQSPLNLDNQTWNLLKKTASDVNLMNPAEFWKQVAARFFVGIQSNSVSPTHTAKEEYFIPEMSNINNQSIFVDLGAFNGDTLERYFNIPIEGNLDSRSAVAVEADFKNFSNLYSRINQRNVYALNAIIGETSGISFFNSTGDVRATVATNSSNSVVAMVTVDEIYRLFNFTHIKFDIEGFEEQALRGAKSAIKFSNAVWSIASYHRVEDFWIIPKYFSKKYSWMVSSHSQRPWDSTMHFRKISCKY